MRVEVINSYSNRQTDEDGALLDLLLSTVAPHHHNNVHKAVNDAGVVAALSDVVTKYWDHKQKEEAVDEVMQWVKLDGEDRKAFKGVYVKILVDAFGVDKHLNQTASHRNFIAKTFKRFGSIFPNISDKQISEHDLSKYSYIEMIGYTERWVWGVSTPAWHNALQHHYTNNPHHPQYSNVAKNNNTPNNETNMSQSNAEESSKQINKMSPSHLEESVVDMLACHWERRQGGREAATAREIADFGGVFLERYTREDRRVVEGLLEKVRNSGL